MKRLLGAILLAFFVLAASVPLGLVPPVRQQAEQAAPQRGEPHVTVVLSATGERVSLLMEEYVAGVVAAEMGDSFPLEALAAQAILARTYSLRRLELGITLSDDPGTAQAYAPERVTEKIREAVDRTRGSIMTHGGELVDAVYHACAGGRTATAPEGMQAPDRLYLRPVADPPCPRDETWSTLFGARELGAAAGVQGAVRSVAIGERGPSGRALTLVVNGKAVNIFRFRDALGGNRLKSTLLTAVRLEGDRVRISGRGWGHGVGLSQWGAAALAGRGFTAEEIIQHYFANVAVELYW
ncbi:MAG TPA: SpoIID/LytB domain-containing protein [Symbiobacteriaceae bacterium]|nr:SpoIID/LytB domain-containing protein [Symbiobacteriaceae bacterium]